MRIQGRVFAGLSVFFLITTIVYGLWSREPVGTTALGLSFGLAIMIGFYLLFTARRSDTGAQDRDEADVADDAGELGFFSPYSWMPLFLAVGASLVILSIVFNWWLLVFAAPVMAISVFGWVFEYYRGENQNQ